MKKRFCVFVLLISLLVTAVPVYAAGTGYETEPDIYSQEWFISEKTPTGNENEYKVKIYLRTNYNVGPVQFKLEGADSIVSVAKGSEYYTSTTYFSKVGMINLIPDTYTQVIAKQMNGCIAEVVYTSATGEQVTIKNDPKNEDNIQGTLMAARCTGEYINASDFLIGQNAVVYGPETKFTVKVETGNLTLEFDESSNTYYVDDCKDNVQGILTIPDEYKGGSIIGINDNAFKGCIGLTEIVIPESIVSIGESAFEGCELLSVINIHANISKIGINAFWGTAFYNARKNWENDMLYLDNYLIKLNKEICGSHIIKPGVKCIAEGAFLECSLLESVTFPNSVEKLSGAMFGDCEALTSVVIPKSISECDENVFKGCNEKLKIKCHEDSYIYSFAKEKQLDYEFLYNNNYFNSDFAETKETADGEGIKIDNEACKKIEEVFNVNDGFELQTEHSLEGYCGTGTVVKVLDENNTVVKEYKIVVQGDVNGDSVCDVIDCMLLELARHESNNVSIDGVYLLAGDFTEDGKIEINDFNAVVNKAIA